MPVSGGNDVVYPGARPIMTGTRRYFSTAMSSASRPFALLLALALPACASMQKERGHDDVDKLVQRRSGYRTGWEQGAPEAQQIAERVNKLLGGGLTRQRAVSIALINSPHLQ